MDIAHLKTALAVLEHEELEARDALKVAQDKRIKAADDLNSALLADKAITPNETVCTYKRWGTPVRCVVEARNGRVTAWEVTKAGKKWAGRTPFIVSVSSLDVESGAA